MLRVLAQRRLAVHLPLQPIDLEAEHPRRLPRVDRQIAFEVPQVQRAFVEPELQFPSLEDLAVLIAEQGQQHLALQLRLDGGPIDVEVARVGRAGTVLEHVAPPGIRHRIAGHVIRHEVGEMTEAAAAKSGAPGRVLLLVSELGIERRVVADVVPVGAPRRRLDVRRAVAVRDAQLLEVRQELRGVGETELAAELEPVRADRVLRFRHDVAAPIFPDFRHRWLPRPDGWTSARLFSVLIDRRAAGTL